MEKMLLILLFVGFAFSPAFADDYVYDSPYGGKKIGKVDKNGYIYDKPYGGKAVGRYDSGKVYNDPYGGKAIGSADSRKGAGCFLLRERQNEGRKK